MESINLVGLQIKIQKHLLKRAQQAKRYSNKNLIQEFRHRIGRYSEKENVVK